MKIKLTEDKIRQIVRESLKKILKEGNEQEYSWDEYYDEDEDNGEYDDDYDEEEYYKNWPPQNDTPYKWSIKIFDKEVESEKSFRTVRQAEKDCNKYLKINKFYDTVKKYNPNLDFDDDENIYACVYLADSNGECIDTMLVNYGWGWYD